MNRFLALALAATLSACGESLPESGDYWLELQNAYGEWEKTILVTGYLDDYQACIEVRQALNEWNADNAGIKREYRCSPA